ncbi:hypothetical protein EYC84_007061 [Monilinia fructicola]|uniref:Uncharacterized protein n=1 Tax=Monilinia fructicola TaxID=38448 RepID=A0A5M9K958_MONFR|nr:hypothetical protein EYC84_007061 [Monilinia fructicola]
MGTRRKGEELRLSLYELANTKKTTQGKSQAILISCKLFLMKPLRTNGLPLSYIDIIHTNFSCDLNPYKQLTLNLH